MGAAPGDMGSGPDSDQEAEIRKRTRWEVEPRWVRKFLRQKAGQPSWEARRVFLYDLTDEHEEETEPMAPPVVLIPSDSEEQSDRRVVTIEVGSDTQVVLTQPLSSPFGSLPLTPGWDIQLPRSLEGQLAAEMLEVQMQRAACLTRCGH